METVIAVKLSGIDENGYMYPHATVRPDVCSICKNRIKDVPNLAYKVKKKHANLLATYDDYLIVSQKMKDFCELNQYEDVEFIALPESSGFYYFTVHKVYELDYEKQKTKFINYRNCCGNYDEIIGSSFFTKKGFSMETDDFIRRTEFRFASYAF